MRRVLSVLPKPVLISVAIMVVALAMLAVLVPVLGGARDEAVARGQQLVSDITGTQSKITALTADQQYVLDNRAAYETLVSGDKLIPHTRRAAVVTLTETATVHGVSDVNYSFSAVGPTSLAAVSTQSAAGGYTVAVESIDLTMDAPLDGPIYRFIADIMQTFPGSLTIESLTLAREPAIGSAALAAVSAGRPSGLVKGEITLSWRTAQADKTTGDTGKPK